MSEIKQINKFNKNGSKTLCSDYLNYRSEGGKLSPLAWNTRIKEMRRENK